MKELLTSFIFLFFTGLMLGQTDTENYVQTTTYKKEGVTVLEIENDQVYSTDKIEEITYYDGLGRPVQQISAQAGGGGQDIITYMEYDGYGRQVKEYLPYADEGQTSYTSSLGYRENILQDIETYYITKYPAEIDNGSPNPYSEKLFETSPLNRVLGQGAPGSSWAVDPESNQDHTIKMGYETNKTKKEVLHFKAVFPSSADTDQPKLAYAGHYRAGELYKTVTKDENWSPNQAHENDHTIEEFKNQEGNLILKRNYSENQKHDTYYVYDKYGNLTYVIPPKASASIIKTFFKPIGIESIYHPWTSLAAVDSRFAEEYNNRLIDYEDEAILNADIENEYGGQGGFSVSTNNEKLSLSITFSAETPLSLKNGQVASLKALGSFPDMELGRIEGVDYNYSFLIVDNQLYIEGKGKLQSVNKTFVGENQLEYTKNYSWIDYVRVDEGIRAEYKEQLRAYENDQILTANIPNPYNGVGGLQFNLTEDNELTITVNHTTGTPLELETKRPVPLDIERRLPDMELGGISGEGYGYSFSIQENNLVIRGKGKISGRQNTMFSAAYTIGSTIRPEAVEGLCYIYHYDHRNRVIRKKIPGKGWGYIVYDKLDRPVMTQDAKQRLDHEWLFTKYDAHNRVAYTGNYVIPEETLNSPNFNDAQEWVRGQVENATILNEGYTTNSGGWAQEDIYYTNMVFPTFSYQSGGGELFTINYYDKYPSGHGNILPSQITVPTNGVTDKTHSLPTVSRVKTLGTQEWATTVTKYDEKGQPLYISTINETLTSEDHMVNTFDFLGNTTSVETEHTKNGSTLTVKDSYSYDHIGRSTRFEQEINGGSSFNPVIYKNTYDELGQLKAKDIGGKVNYYGTYMPPLQKVDYSYNIRGWLTKINNPSDLELGQDNSMADLFAFEIAYDQPSLFGNSRPLYNGNISETSWKTANDNKLRGYYYEYDALNRIIKAQNPPIGLRFGEFYTKYELSNVGYDRNGNIMNLKRTGQSSIMMSGQNQTDIIDDLTYHYKPYSNQLEKVGDAQLGFSGGQGFMDGANTGDDYSYDLNGNMLEDKNKGIVSIEYNHLNLPTHIEIESATSSNINSIHYIYDATGVKLEKRVTDHDNYIAGDPTSTITQYAGNYIYKQENQSQAMNLKFFSHPEGYVEPKDPSNYALGFDYVYQYKDHLGNIRLSYKSVNGSLQIQEENNYYPFGLEHKGYNNVVNGSEHPYKYNGKELEKELGLGWYDYQARRYDPVLGRWHVVDPAAELMRRFSPYSYVFNNPLVFVDRDGMLPEDIVVRGANGSSITVATNLIDVEVDASSLGIDFGGNYTFSGNDVLITALDIAGTIDPTPSMDVLSASLSADGGDWWGAAASVTGAVVPYAGDLAKGPKMVKGVNNIMKAIDAGEGTVKQAAKKTAANAKDKTYQTYIKTNAKTGEVYTGRTSGTGTPAENIAKRDGSHHKNKDGFGKAELDQSSTNKDAIRGREQQLIEANGGAKSQGGTSGNAINGVGSKNKKATQYKEAAEKEF